MKTRHWIITIILLLLIGTAGAGLWWTRDVAQSTETDTASTAAVGKGSTPRSSSWRGMVDQRPVQMARKMAALAGTPEEQKLAHEADKVADHEVDLAFYDAIRAAQENPPALSPEAKQIADRKEKARKAVKDDQDNVTLLTGKLATAPEAQKDKLQDQLDVAKAQLELDQDELDDASEDLEQAGGDPESKIKRLQAEHEAGGHGDAPVGTGVNPRENDYRARTFLGAFRAWQALRDKRKALEEARQFSITKQQRLNARHDKLAAKVEQEKQNRESVKQQATGFSKESGATGGEESKTMALAALLSLKEYTLDQKTLADLARRTLDEQELEEIYANWISLIETRRSIALHNMIRVLMWILLVVLVVYLSNRGIDRATIGLKAENKRAETLRAVLKFSAQAIGLIAILFLIFGVPNETTTIIGLAGAGLTVAMKDFIMAFLGWFALMGRNGIRVGDWVEINGVGGEVVEIGLLKTVLLETGNWTDAGHPTGRKVSFMNSFAIEGHFFNFTTSGQWMWDELKLTIPANLDPYTVIEGIQSLVGKETETNAHKAEDEWQHTTQRYRVQAFSAAPAINVVPSGDAVEVRVRYITRAYERHEMRKRLYEAVVKLMHQRPQTVKS